jgi:hypothetical protein
MTVLDIALAYLEEAKTDGVRLLLACKIDPDQEHEYLYEIKCVGTWTVKNLDTYRPHKTHQEPSREGVLARVERCGMGITRIILETSAVRFPEERESLTLYYRD